MEVSGQLHVPAALPPGKEPLDRRLGGPQSHSHHNHHDSEDHHYQYHHDHGNYLNNYHLLYDDSTTTTTTSITSIYDDSPSQVQVQVTLQLMVSQSVSWSVLLDS